MKLVPVVAHAASALAGALVADAAKAKSRPLLAPARGARRGLALHFSGTFIRLHIGLKYSSLTPYILFSYTTFAT